MLMRPFPVGLSLRLRPTALAWPPTGAAAAVGLEAASRQLTAATLIHKQSPENRVCADGGRLGLNPCYFGSPLLLI